MNPIKTYLNTTYITFQSLKHLCKKRGEPFYEPWNDKKAGFNNFIKDMGEKPGPNFSLRRKRKNGSVVPENLMWDENRNNKKPNGPPRKYKNLHEMISEYKAYRNILSNSRYYGDELWEPWACKEEGFQNFIKDMGLKPDPMCRLSKRDVKQGYTPDNMIWKLVSKKVKEG
jgi:hypothetical protein